MQRHNTHVLRGGGGWYGVLNEVGRCAYSDLVVYQIPSILGVMAHVICNWGTFGTCASWKLFVRIAMLVASCVVNRLPFFCCGSVGFQ